MRTTGIGSYSFVELPDNVTVGNYTMIGNDCYFFSRNERHQYSYNKKIVYTTNIDQNEVEDKGMITIGHDCWLGKGVWVLNGISIGDGAVIGARTMVTKDVPAYAVVVGNPGKIIKYRFSPEQIEQLERIQWWLWPITTVRDRKEEMKDIDVFLKSYSI